MIMEVAYIWFLFDLIFNTFSESLEMRNVSKMLLYVILCVSN